MALISFIQEWRSFFRYRRLPSEKRSIVFYAEDASSWRYFEPIISQLCRFHRKEICYITSSNTDPVLDRSDSQLQSFYIGTGTVRTIFFLFLRADAMVMTMPDLGTYQIKRSNNPVKYIYVYHSIISTHMAYRPGAFDNYDQILCVGPHHTDEIRAAEEFYGIKPKLLLDGGYVILDSIIETTQGSKKSLPDGSKRILIAPSWGSEGLIESVGLVLVAVLLKAGYRVTVRPHVMTIRQRHPALSEMQERFANDADFQLDLGLASQGTVSDTDLLISDWSGAALEYALGLEKPVIFVDVPRKVNNPNFEDIPQVPIEVILRAEVGEVVPLDRLADVPAVIERLCENPGLWRGRMQELREKWIYNLGCSAEVMAAHIARAADTNDPDPERED